MKKINVGDLNQIVTLQKSKVINKDGIQIEEWNDVSEKWAFVKNSSYKKMEFSHEQGIVSLQCKDFILRECEISYKDRIIYKNGIYDIKTEPVEVDEGFILVTGVKLNG